jgi:N-acetyl-gamma-glutamylphosphate reductase
MENSSQNLRVAIFGGSGYGGSELLWLNYLGKTGLKIASSWRSMRSRRVSIESIRWSRRLTSGM